MRKFLAGLVLMTVLAATSLMARPALAAGPSDGTGPWVFIADPGSCDLGYHEMFNAASGKTHCFPD
jgi:hypothetical protein